MTEYQGQRLIQQQQMQLARAEADIKILEQYKDKESLFSYEFSSNTYRGVLRIVGEQFTYWTNLKKNSHDNVLFIEEHPDRLNEEKFWVDNEKLWNEVSPRCIPRSAIEQIVLVSDILNQAPKENQ